MGSTSVELYNYDEEVTRLASDIRRFNSLYDPKSFLGDDDTVVKHYFETHPVEFADYKQQNPESPVVNIAPDLNYLVETIEEEQRRMPIAEKAADPWFALEATGKEGLFAIPKSLEKWAWTHGRDLGQREVKPKGAPESYGPWGEFNEYATPEERKEYIAETIGGMKEIEERWTNSLNNWYSDNPRAQAHLLYKSKHPAGWNPFKWETTDIANMAGTGITEVATQIPIYAATGPVGSFLYNFGRIYGGEVQGDFERMKELGFTDEQALETATLNSFVSAGFQSVPEILLSGRIAKRLFGKSHISKAITPAKNSIARTLALKSKGKSGSLSKFITEDLITPALLEGVTEYGQFLIEETVNKYGYDRGIDLWEKAISDEAAENFWTGVIAGGAAGITAGVASGGFGDAVSNTLKDIGNRFNTKVDTEASTEAAGIIINELIEAQDGLGATPERKQAAKQANNTTLALGEAERKIATLAGRKLDFDLAERMEEEAKVRSNEAIIIDRIISGSDEKLTPAEVAQFNFLEEAAQKRGMSREQMLQEAIETEEAITASAFSPEVVAEYVDTNDMGMPEHLAPFSPLPEVGPEPPIQPEVPFVPEPPIKPEPPFVPEPPVKPEPPFVPISPEQLEKQIKESLIAQGAKPSDKKAKATIVKWNSINEKVLEDAGTTDIKQWLMGEKYQGENVKERAWILKQLEYGGDENILDQTKMKPFVLQTIKEVGELIIEKRVEGAEKFSFNKKSLALKTPYELKRILTDMGLNAEGGKSQLIGRIINAPKKKKDDYLQLVKRQKTEVKKKEVEKLAVKKELEEKIKAEGKIKILDVDKKESRIVPLTDPTAGDKASEAIGRYMGAVYKKMGDSADYHMGKGTVKLPKKINFRYKNESLTIEKLDDVPFRDSGRRKIDPDKGFYKLIDSKGKVIQEVFPATREAQRLLEENERRKIARIAKNTEFIEFMFGQRPSAGDDLQIVGKQFYPNKTAHLAIMKSFSESDIPHLPEEMKYLLDKIEMEDLLGLPLDRRQLRNRDVFLSKLKESLYSAKDVYEGKDFDKKFNTIMAFFEYLPKHVFNNVITFLEDFNGKNYGYTLSMTHLPIGYVAPWRGILQKVYEIHDLDISKIDLINTDQAAREGWFEGTVASGERKGQSYIRRRDAIINHLKSYHGDKFGKPIETAPGVLDHSAIFNEIEFAIEKASLEVRKDIEKALTKRLKDKYGINNALKLLPIVMMTFGKSKVNVSDQIFETPIHELVHHIEFLAEGTPEWKKVQTILDKIAKREEMAPFLVSMIPNYIDKVFEDLVKGIDPNIRIKSELLAHIMQRVVYDELGLADQYTESETDTVIDKILEEGKKGETLYDKLKSLILRIVKWISNKFRGKAFEDTDTVYDYIVDLRKAFYEVVHKKDIFEEPFKNKTVYFSKPYYSRIAKNKEDIYRTFDFMWQKAQERTKGVTIDADVFLNDVSNMLDEHNLGEFKVMFHEWIDSRSKAKKINWNRHLREKNPSIREFSWLSGYQSAAVSEQLYYDQLYMLEEVDMTSVHMRKSGNLLDFIPLFSLGISLTRVKAGILAESTKNDITFDEWLAGPQAQLTLVSPSAMTPEQKRLMHIYYLKTRQALYTNQPLLLKSSTNLLDRIPQNQRPYVRLTKIKRTDKDTKEQGITYKMNYIDKNTREYKGLADFPVSRPSTIAPTMADFIVPEVTKNMLWLSNSQFYEDKAAWSDKYYRLMASRDLSYSFLNSKDIQGANDSQKDLVFITVRGDSEIAYFARITDSHRELAKDFGFWNDQLKMEFITEEQLKDIKKELKNKDEQYKAGEIAFFETMNGLLPGFAKWKNGADVVKRVKSAMLTAMQVEGLSEQKVLKVNKNHTSIKIGDTVYDMMQDIPDVGIENIFDGATWSGYDHFDEMSEKGGIPKNAGVMKTGWYYVNEKKHLLLAKHAQFRVVKGMKWLDGLGNVIAEVGKDGLIRTASGEVIQHVMSDDELKKATGIYSGNKVIKIPGKAIGIVQWTGKEKKYTKFLRQFFNFVPDNDFSRDFIKHVLDTGRANGIKTKMTKHMKALQTAEGVKAFVNKAVNEYPDIMSNTYTTAVNIGGGRHPMVSRILLGYSDFRAGNRYTKYKGFVVDKVIHNAINLDGFRGTQAYFRPNVGMDANELELNLSYNLSKFLFNRFKESTGAQASLSNMNIWLKRNPINVAVFRSPVPHRAGGLYMKINKLLEENDIVEFNPITVKRYFEGDQDFDKAHIVLLPKALEPSAKKYFESEEFKKSMKGISLEGLISKEKLDIMVRDSRYTIMEAMNVGKKAIAQIANVQLIYGMLQDILESVTINGIVFKVRDPESKIDASEMKEGLKESLETVLRKYLQSSVDNAKYLLLHHWDWTRDSMIEKLFVSEDGEALSSFEGYIDTIKETIWSKMQEAVEILNAGTFDTQLDFSALIEKSENYRAFINNRNEIDFVPKGFEEVSYQFKEDAININEQLAIAPAEVFSEDFISNKLSSLEYTTGAYLDAHIDAVEKVDDRLRTYIDDNAEAIKKEFKKDSIDQILKIAGITGKNYSVGGRGLKVSGLMNAISSFTGGGRPIYPNYWDTNEIFIAIREKYNERFKKLNPLTRKLATLVYLKELTTYRDKHGKGELRLDMIPLPIDYISKETLLDKSIMSAYFKAFDKRLDSGTKLSKRLKELRCV